MIICAYITTSKTELHITKLNGCRFSCVPDKVKLCELYNTESDDDLNISSYLIDQDVAWPGKYLIDQCMHERVYFLTKL